MSLDDERESVVAEHLDSRPNVESKRPYGSEVFVSSYSSSPIPRTGRAEEAFSGTLAMYEYVERGQRKLIRAREP